MKKIVLSTLTVLSAGLMQAQEFPGFRTSNYAGVNGAFFNPATIADSRYRFDLNLFSLSSTVGNDQAAFKLSTIADDFKDDNIKDQLLGNNAGAASGIVNMDFHGPSLMFNIGKKNAVALTTRARVFANAAELDGKLFDKISSDFTEDPSLPYTISSTENMRIDVHGWSEFGLSFGRVLAEHGVHRLKGGVSLKYLAGAGNAFVNIDNFNGTISDDVIARDVYLHNASGRLATGFGGINFSDFEAGDLLEMESTGFGADLGFVYEQHRPGTDHHKLKFGVSILDIGSITYDKDMQRSGGYDIDINGTERMSLQDLDGVEFDNLKEFFDDRPQFFTAAAGNQETTYKVSLPTTLQLDADYHITSGLFVNVAGQIPLTKADSKRYGNRSYTSVSVTPRFENRRFGIYLPLNYNELTSFNAGASVRVGPLFLGSGSILTALMGNSKQADIHLGIRIGILKR